MVIQESQPPVLSSNSSSSSSSSKARLPVMLIRLMVAVSPSTMSIFTATRLRSRGVTEDFSWTAYLPWLKYWRRSSCSILSRTERLSTRPSASPMSFRAVSSSSVSRDLLPEMSILAMAGRSRTETISRPPSRSRRTSWKKPVLNRVRMISGER